MYLLIVATLLMAPTEKKDTRKIAKTSFKDKLTAGACKKTKAYLKGLMESVIPSKIARARSARSFPKRLLYTLQAKQAMDMAALETVANANCLQRRIFQRRYRFISKVDPAYHPSTLKILTKGKVYVAARYWSKKRARWFRRQYKRQIKMLQNAGYSTFLFISRRHHRVYRWSND